MKYDVCILGGGIVGCSIAWHLVEADAALEVAVIERDPTYEFAATPRGNGGIRQLFSLPENIAMAQYGLGFYGGFKDRFTHDGDDASIGFKQQGYLFVSDGGHSEAMRQNFEVQRANGVNAILMTPQQMCERFPSISPHGVTCAVYSPDDAWIDPYAALQALKREASRRGVAFVRGDVREWQTANAAPKVVRLSDARSLSASAFVIACGAWSAEIAALIGLDLPVEPMSRESYFFRCAEKIEPLPFVKTETDWAIRPEGDGFVGGLPNWSETAGWNFDLSSDWFDEKVWPALADRIPPMQALRLVRSWRGHYARNTLDLSPIIGPWEGGAGNVFMATGFSGHGIMHAPAAGRAIAERVLRGAYQTIDLDRFGYGRIAKQQPYRESGIV